MKNEDHRWEDGFYSTPSSTPAHFAADMGSLSPSQQLHVPPAPSQLPSPEVLSLAARTPVSQHEALGHRPKRSPSLPARPRGCALGQPRDRLLDKQRYDEAQLLLAEMFTPFEAHTRQPRRSATDDRSQEHARRRHGSAPPPSAVALDLRELREKEVAPLQPINGAMPWFPATEFQTSPRKARTSKEPVGCKPWRSSAPAGVAAAADEPHLAHHLDLSASTVAGTLHSSDCSPCDGFLDLSGHFGTGSGSSSCAGSVGGGAAGGAEPLLAVPLPEGAGQGADCDADFCKILAAALAAPPPPSEIPAARSAAGAGGGPLDSIEPTEQPPAAEDGALRLSVGDASDCDGGEGSPAVGGGDSAEEPVDGASAAPEASARDQEFCQLLASALASPGDGLVAVPQPLADPLPIASLEADGPAQVQPEPEAQQPAEKQVRTVKHRDFNEVMVARRSRAEHCKVVCVA